MDQKKIAQYLDFANHHADAKPEDIKALCQKVKKYGFHSAFVNPCYIALAKETLESLKVPKNLGKVGAVIAFPLGQEVRDVKIVSAIKAARDGVDELDVSMNVGLFKAGEEDEVLEEMEAVVTAAKNVKRAVLVKFIIETGYLTDEEIKRASELVFQSGADFVKTCSGWGPRGSELKDVKLIRQAIGDKIKIKVAGGIDTYQEAVDFIKAGADRIGTSKAVEIVSDKR